MSLSICPNLPFTTVSKKSRQACLYPSDHVSTPYRTNTQQQNVPSIYLVGLTSFYDIDTNKDTSTVDNPCYIQETEVLILGMYSRRPKVFRDYLHSIQRLN